MASSPTADDVHIPAAIGKKKKAVATGKIPPQFLPKQKGKVEPDGDAMKMRGKPPEKATPKGEKATKARGKAGAKMGAVPPQFLPKQKGAKQKGT